MSDCGRDCGCASGVSRRELLKAGAGTAAAVYGVGGAQAAPGDIPPACRERPSQAWFDQLIEAGEPIRYRGRQLENLIFPLGGIGTGTIWLHGTGRLVNWQIFNNIQKDSQVDDTFFAVRIEPQGEPPVIRVLQQQAIGPFAGMGDVTFTGQYPFATLSLRDKDVPVEIELEAFNPLVPLNEKDSAIPCAIFTLRVRNTSDKPVRVSLLGSLQNAVGHAGKGEAQGVGHGSYGGNVNYALNERRFAGVAMKGEVGKPAEVSPPIELIVDHDHFPRLDESPVRGLTLAGFGQERNTAGVKTIYWLGTGDLELIGGSALGQIARDVREHGSVLLLSGGENPLARPIRASEAENVRRREHIYATFDDKGFGQWRAEGDAFRHPRSGASPTQNPVTGFLGASLVNSFDPNDHPKGTLNSPPFVIKEPYISFLIGGGNHPQACCMNLKIDGKVVRTATGENTEHLRRVDWDVSEFVEREARIEIVDSKSNPWGHILVDDIRFGNLPVDAVTADEASAWNGLIDRLTEAGPMQRVEIGKGRMMLVPAALGRDADDEDAIRQRDQLLSMLAPLADVSFKPQVGRPGDAPSFGTMTLVTAETDASAKLAWQNRDELFQEFSETGRLSTRITRTGAALSIPPAGPTGPGETLNAALCVERTVPPNNMTQATFAFTWNFPHQYYPQNNYRAANNPAVPVGNMYTNWYADAPGVARYLFADYDNLRRRTMAYREAMFDTTLPQYFVDAAAANVSIIRSPTCFWTKDGTFYGFEGCVPTGGGCCPMNCNHVWNYEQTLARLWPGLARDMRRTELKFHQREDGGTNHRVAVPRDNPNKHAPPVADGQCGAVLKAYREHLQSANSRFLDDYWASIRKAMDFAIREWDPNGDGVMEEAQFNTYDRVIFGENTFVSSLYLAALRAAETMARIRQERETAQRYRDLYEHGRERIARTLFNGEYYIEDIESAIASRKRHEKKQGASDERLAKIGEQEGLQGGYGKGCWSDQVVGQWWARVLDLGDILPEDQVRSALKAIFKHSFLWRIEGFEGTQRFLQFANGQDKGLLCGSWPRGERPNDPIYYRDECWTGVEYQVAGHKLYEGQIEEGMAIVKGARERYDGTKRSPWNEIECGDYYARALSSWSLLLAAQGYAYDGPARKLAFNPCMMADDHRSFFTTAAGWGRFEQKRADKTQTATLTMLDGRCELSSLRLGLPAEAGSVRGTVRLNDADPVPDIRFAEGHAQIKFGGGIALAVGDRLNVSLDWS